jgi:hypothetical protein
MDFLIDEARVASLSATRQGRVSMGGFAYQAAYAVSRYASMRVEQFTHDLVDPQVGLRFDWADDLDEVLRDGSVRFTQCKRSQDAGRPARVADVLLGLAPKFLWTPEDTRDRLRFRLVSPDLRFGHALVPATSRPVKERKAVRLAFIAGCQTAPPEGSDRQLWQQDADTFGAGALFDALWARLDFLYASDAVLRDDPAGVLFQCERDALNLLLNMQLTDQARQRDALRALRALLHANLVDFDPAGTGLVDVGRRSPRAVSVADVISALFSYRRARVSVLPFRVVDRAFLDARHAESKEPFVARFPSWRDVVHGEDPELRFIERDVTGETRGRVEALLAGARQDELTPALFIVGGPGSGKSTLARRVAAQLVLDGVCTVADAGARLDPLDDEEIQAMRGALDELSSSGRPVLLLLDDPFFSGSSWPDALRRLRHVPRISVLAVSPTLLFERYRSELPNGVQVQSAEIGPLTASERGRVAVFHGRDPDTFVDSEDLLTVAMEASAGTSFDEIVSGIWRTLNNGRSVAADTLPDDLPLLMRTYLVVAYFHRFGVMPREALLLAALSAGGQAGASQWLTYQLSELRGAQGWNLFELIQPAQRYAWTGAAVGTTHTTIARAAWEVRPLPWFDVAEWVVPAAVAEAAGAYEMGEFAATLLASEPRSAERLIAGLTTAWQQALEDGRAEPRNLALFVAGGKRLDSRFPGLDEAFAAAAARGGPQAWLAGYQLYLNSGLTAEDRSYPTSVDLERVIDQGDFSLAESRSVNFVRSLPVELVDRVWRRMCAALNGETGWKPTGGQLTAMLVANDQAAHLDGVVSPLVRIAESGRDSYGLLAALLSRAHEYSRQGSIEIVEATISALSASYGDRSAEVVATAARPANARIRKAHGDDERTICTCQTLLRVIGEWWASLPRTAKETA